MGSRTPVLLLSTWTTPNVLDLPLPRLPVQPKPPPQFLVPLLVQAREHKRTGRVARRWPQLPPLPRHLSHLRSNSPSSSSSAVPRASIVLLSFLNIIFGLRSSSSGASLLFLSLWPQVRAEPGLLPTHQPLPTSPLMAAISPGEVLFPGLGVSKCVTAASRWLQRRGSGQEF